VTNVKLHAICHARAGDKGNDSLLVLVPFDLADFEPLVQAVQPALVAHHFNVAPSDVEVRLARNVSALVITVRGRLYGGVTRSLTIDPHGKTLSGHLLDMEVDWTDSPSEPGAAGRALRRA
jgi:hypothetical protein